MYNHNRKMIEKQLSIGHHAVQNIERGGPVGIYYLLKLQYF